MSDFTMTHVTTPLEEAANVPTTTTTTDRIVAASRGTGSTIKAATAAARVSLMGVEMQVPPSISCFIQLGTNPANAEPVDSVSGGTWFQVPPVLPTMTSGTYLIIMSIRGGATGTSQLAHLAINYQGQLVIINRAGSLVSPSGLLSGVLTPGAWIWIALQATVGTTGTAPASTNGVIKAAYYNAAGVLVDSKSLSAMDTGQVQASHYRIGAGSASAFTAPSLVQLRYDGTIFKSGETTLIPPPAGAPSGDSLTSVMRAIDYGWGGASSIASVTQTGGPAVELLTSEGEIYFFDDLDRTETITFNATLQSAGGTKAVTGSFPGYAIAGAIIGDGPAVWDSVGGVWVD